ncbi:MAG: hypothetical protein CMM52_06740 [Rhodospirillaceae bacterium]|nr:hypothetical protein [Rhodospirillaceae bacterium]|tara:strand:- start:16726 stop:18402 length:1677 start_codon:yes stop_codon:yes gene_type:complete
MQFGIKKTLFLLLALFLCIPGSANAAGKSPETVIDAPRHSRLVFPGADEKLVYNKESDGTRLPDFSHAGFRGGGIPIPTILEKVMVRPSGGEDRETIQAAIDQVSALSPDKNGFRGAVLLKVGRYKVTGTLYIEKSGVVLRGEAGTVIDHHTADGKKGEKTSLFLFSPNKKFGKWSHKKVAVKGTRRKIVDGYVPLGARKITLKSASGLKVDDAIVVVRRSTAKWISALGMDAIPERDDGRRIKQWRPGKYDIPYYRFISSISGNVVTLDAPLFHSLSKEYGPSYIQELDLSSVLRNVGVEQLEAVSHGASFFDSEAHPWTMIEMQGVYDGWVRDVTSRKYAHALIKTGRFTRNISVARSRYLEPESEVRGRRRYPFHLQGQLHLGWRLFAENGRHDFVTGRQWSSGIVFLESRSVGTLSVTEPHHRYSTGILYDNVRIEKPGTDRLVMALWNRSNFGSGHGWAAANSVLWNCVAGSGVAVEKPPLAQNYAIGVRSPAMTGNANRNQQAATETFQPNGAHWEWWNHGPVTPQSLYRAQMRDRLGEKGLAALENGMKQQ